MTYNSDNALVFAIYIYIYTYMNNTVYTLLFLTYGEVCNNSINSNSFMNKQ